MGRIPSRGSDQFMVRFPNGMRDRIREEADKNGRSMNAEIIARLEDSLDPRGRANVFGVATSLPAEDRREAAMLAEAIEQYMRRKWRERDK